MTIPTLSRIIVCALIGSLILFLKTDQAREPAPIRKANHSFVLTAQGNRNLDRAARANIEQSYGKLPMRFEANEGQTDPRVKFIARGAGYSVFLTGDEAALRLYRRELGNGEIAGRRTAETPVESMTLRMKLASSNSSNRVSGIGKLNSSSNYFTGNDPAAWRRGVSNYSKVKYESVYPGIDLVWYGNQRLLEHDFLVAPGADPCQIKLSFSGMDKMSIDGEGALALRAGGEDLRLLKPLAWQESNGDRRTVNCDYRIGDMNQVEFRLGEYDTTLPLVIDPVLVYSTYIGGIGADTGSDIAVDGEGSAYICGSTSSADFPGPSPIQPVKGASSEAFVLKINPAGSAIVFGAWIGGNGSDSAATVSVDQGGNIYLAGSTSSSDFPLQNPLQSSIRGPQDAFAVKIDSSGSTLLYSTYIGGTGADRVTDLAIDGAGNLHLTGATDSVDFPIVNAFQTVKNGSGAYASDNG
ncbi:MAG TPA: SBBP repeat-containing protein, partial [Blastocatellia bacterium]|nr:SBBP repeat-containing protein [Blastocatellia bacterium]